MSGYLVLAPVSTASESTTSGEYAMEERIPNVTPGEILSEEFLKPMGISAYRLSKDTGMPATRVSQIVKGKRRITADTALRLSKYFGNSADFWLGIQDEYDLREEKRRIEPELARIPRAREHADA